MPRSLLERLAELHDPRDPRGRVFPLAALLGLSLVAILAGHRQSAHNPTGQEVLGRKCGSVASDSGSFLQMEAAKR